MIHQKGFVFYTLDDIEASLYKTKASYFLEENFKDPEMLNTNDPDLELDMIELVSLYGGDYLIDRDRIRVVSAPRYLVEIKFAARILNAFNSHPVLAENEKMNVKSGKLLDRYIYEFEKISDMYIDESPRNMCFFWIFKDGELISVMSGPIRDIIPMLKNEYKYKCSKCRKSVKSEDGFIPDDLFYKANEDNTIDHYCGACANKVDIKLNHVGE